MRTVWRAVLDGMTPYDAGKPLAELAAELGLPELVRLSANENPLGPSPHVLDAIAREAARAHLYPDGGAVALRDALARRLGVRPDQLVVGNGADELIGLVAFAAFEPGDEVVVPQPSFEPYATSVVLAGARAVLSPLAGYETDLDDIRRKVSGRTKAVMLCSPHNPTATIIRKAPLLAFLDALGADPPLVVLDEAYYDFADDPEYPHGVALLARYPRPRGAPLPLGGAAEARLYLPAVAGELPAREGPRRGGPQGQAPPRGPPRAGRRRRRLPRPPPDLGRPPRGEREAARDIVAGAARPPRSVGGLRQARSATL